MSPEEVLQVAAVAMALVFAYVPGLKGWFDGLSTAAKLLVQLGIFAVIIFGAAAGGCLELLNYACESWGSAMLTAGVLFLKVALMNQGTYQGTRLAAKAIGSE
jgi:hypothetical protein